LRFDAEHKENQDASYSITVLALVQSVTMTSWCRLALDL